MNNLYVRGASGRYRKAARNDVMEAHKAYVAETIVKTKKVAGSSGDTRRLLHEYFAGLLDEQFVCMFLCNRHHVISIETLFYGTIDGCSVPPRTVVRRCLELNAAALILAHNHPSGVAEPSREDRALTRRLQEAVKLVDTRLLDHVVIGDGESVSFAERGWM